MDKQELQQRTKSFALNIIQLVEQFPRSKAADVIAGQLLRAATSVGANYRAACRSRSQADFIARIGIVEEEADECIYWLDLAQSAGVSTAANIHPLLQEADELTAIFTASGRTARRNRNLSRPK